jgi:hypothetical protein
MAILTAPSHGDSRTSNAEQPPLQRALGAIPFDAGQGGDERLLRQILGERFVDDESAQEAQHAWSINPRQRLPRRIVTPLRRSKQRLHSLSAMQESVATSSSMC